MIELLRESPVPRDSVAWLFKAVRYRAINLARSETRRSKHQQQSAELRESWFDPEPENEFDSEELEGFLAQLPSLDREILVARIWGEMSFEQIANLVESNSSTVHRRYQSALKRLESLIHCPVKKQSEQMVTDDPFESMDSEFNPGDPSERMSELESRLKRMRPRPLQVDFDSIIDSKNFC